MPGFWGQYGPKVRDASFLGPLHYAYDHFDHEYRKGENFRMEHLCRDLTIVNYTFNNFTDMAAYPDDDLIIPLFYLQEGQTILSIEGGTITPLITQTPLDASKMGLWLFNKDFGVVLDEKLFTVPPIAKNGQLFESPDNLPLKMRFDMGDKNYDLEVQGGLHRYFDLEQREPPFLADTDDRPTEPTTGSFICLCLTRDWLRVNQLLLRLTLTIVGNRYQA